MKIHFLSDSPKINTGFSIVTRNLALGLMKLDHDVSCTGIQTSYLTENYYGIKTLPLATDQPEDIQFMNNVMEINPDVIIYIRGMYSSEDPIHLTKMFPNPFCKAVQWVYCPVEGFNIPKRMVSDLNDVASRGGKVIAQTIYGYNEMKKSGVNVSGYVYHGYDPGIFKKTDLNNITDDVRNEIVSFLKVFEVEDNLSGKKNKNWTRFDIPVVELKKEFVGKFVYLFHGANHALRKRIERLLRAYAILISESKQLKDNTRLHLHTLPVNMTGINLLEIVEELGIKDNVSFSFGKDSGGWSEGALNVLYNLAGVHVSATSSEGFGLNHLQTMAVGLPQIAPNCTSLTELIGDGEKDPEKSRGLLALIESNVMLQDGSYRSLVDQEHLAMMMKKIYIQKELREKLGDNAEKWAKQWSWDRICSGWNKSLNELNQISEKNTL